MLCRTRPARSACLRPCWRQIRWDSSITSIAEIVPVGNPIGRRSWPANSGCESRVPADLWMELDELVAAKAKVLGRKALAQIATSHAGDFAGTASGTDCAEVQWNGASDTGATAHRGGNRGFSGALAEENRNWGYRRIQGAISNLYSRDQRGRAVMPTRDCVPQPAGRLAGHS
jgi:hypothetical protein